MRRRRLQRQQKRARTKDYYRIGEVTKIVGVCSQTIHNSKLKLLYLAKNEVNKTLSTKI